MAFVFCTHCLTAQNFVNSGQQLRCINCSIGFLSFFLLHFVSEPESLCLFSVYFFFFFLSSKSFYSFPAIIALIPVTFLPCASFSQQLHLSMSLCAFPVSSVPGHMSIMLVRGVQRCLGSGEPLISSLSQPNRFLPLAPGLSLGD